MCTQTEFGEGQERFATKGKQTFRFWIVPAVVIIFLAASCSFEDAGGVEIRIDAVDKARRSVTYSIEGQGTHTAYACDFWGRDFKCGEISITYSLLGRSTITLGTRRFTKGFSSTTRDAGMLAAMGLMLAAVYAGFCGLAYTCKRIFLCLNARTRGRIACTGRIVVMFLIWVAAANGGGVMLAAALRPKSRGGWFNETLVVAAVAACGWIVYRRAVGAPFVYGAARELSSRNQEASSGDDS